MAMLNVVLEPDSILGGGACGGVTPLTRHQTVDDVVFTSTETLERRPWLEILRIDGFRAFCKAFLDSSLYEYILSFIVMGNCILMGIEQTFRLNQKEDDLLFLDNFELAFLLFYMAELCLYFYAWRLKCLSSNWVRLYMFLVLLGVTSRWVITPLAGRLSSVLLLRVMRLLRLARVVRLVVAFKEVRMLAIGLLQSLKTLLHTIVLGGMLIYVLAVVAMELVPLAMQEGNLPASDEIRHLVNNNFNSLPNTMLTLVQFLTFDNAVFIYKPLMEVDHSLALFFMPVLGLLGMVFMNLVTATMVNGGLEQALEDRVARSAVLQARRKGLLVDLEETFHAADINKSGSISRAELEAMDAQTVSLLAELFPTESLITLFDCLDVDHNGELGIEEFCHGIEGILVSQVPMTVKRLERMVETLTREIKECMAERHKVEVALDAIMAALNIKGPPVHNYTKTLSTTCTVTAAPEAPLSEERRLPLEVPVAGSVGASLRPAWADELMQEVKEGWKTDTRQAVEDACTVLFERITSGSKEGLATPSLSSSDSTPNMAADWAEAIPSEDDCQSYCEAASPAGPFQARARASPTPHSLSQATLQCEYEPQANAPDRPPPPSCQKAAPQPPATGQQEGPPESARTPHVPSSHQASLILPLTPAVVRPQVLRAAREAHPLQSG